MKRCKKNLRLFILLLSAVVIIISTLTACSSGEDKNKNEKSIETGAINDDENNGENSEDEDTADNSKNEQTVAIVNGIPISKDELYEYYVKQYGDAALNQLITERIIGFESEKQSIEVKEEEIDRKLTQFKEYYGGEESFNQQIEQAGIQLNDILSDLELNLKLEKLLEPEITITEEEMQAFFNENENIFFIPEQVKASHILVHTLESANQIRDKLLEGEDFASLAQEFSQDPGSKDAGGALGVFQKGDMIAEFEEAVFSMEAGDISEPVKTEYGFHIIKCEEKIPPEGSTDFQDNKDEVREILTGEKIKEIYGTWIDSKFTEYGVESFLK